MTSNQPYTVFKGVLRSFLIVVSAFLVTFVSLSGLRASENQEQSSDVIEILAFGDSLTAGYGLGPGEGYTDQLQRWLNANMDVPVKVVNGGVSGDTSTGGRSRLDWALSPIKGGKPDLVILELGANDALRGVSPDITRVNIDAMVKLLKERDIPVLVAGMLATPSWGEAYGRAFDSIYPDVATTYEVPLYPFFLEGVAADPDLNQNDGLHPNTKGVEIIVGKMGPVIQTLLEGR